jgi:hypothetical protein
MIQLLIGYIAGIFSLAVFALYFSRATKARPQDSNKRSIAAIGAGGHGITMESYQARMLESVLRHYEGQA